MKKFLFFQIKMLSEKNDIFKFNQNMKSDVQITKKMGEHILLQSQQFVII